MWEGMNKHLEADHVLARTDYKEVPQDAQAPLSRTTLRIRGRATVRILPIRPSGCAVWALWPMFCGSDPLRHP